MTVLYLKLKIFSTVFMGKYNTGLTWLLYFCIILSMNGPKSTTEEVEKRIPRTSVLGVGSFEQHSAHLPLETDFYFAKEISRIVSEKIDAFYLNPLPYSVSLEHRDFPGTVLLKPDTLKRTVWDIAESVHNWGVSYLAIINFHGGNFILNPAAREWNMERKLPHIILVDFFAGFKDMYPNLHAGEVETSMMLYLNPDNVRMDKLDDFIPQWERPDLTHFGMKNISPKGLWGNAKKADASKGKRWVNTGIDYCIERIKETRRFFKSIYGE